VIYSTVDGKFTKTEWDGRTSVFAINLDNR